MQQHSYKPKPKFLPLPKTIEEIRKSNKTISVDQWVRLSVKEILETVKKN